MFGTWVGYAVFVSPIFCVNGLVRGTATIIQNAEPNLRRDATKQDSETTLCTYIIETKRAPPWDYLRPSPTCIVQYYAVEGSSPTTAAVSGVCSGSTIPFFKNGEDGVLVERDDGDNDGSGGTIKWALSVRSFA